MPNIKYVRSRDKIHTNFNWKPTFIFLPHKILAVRELVVGCATDKVGAYQRPVFEFGKARVSEFQGLILAAACRSVD